MDRDGTRVTVEAPVVHHTRENRTLEAANRAFNVDSES